MLEVSVGARLTITGNRLVVERCRQALTIDNPAHAEALRHGRPLQDIPRTLRLFEEIPGGIITPRGFIPALRRIVRGGFPLAETTATAPATFPALQGVTLRSYQENAVTGALRAAQGLIQAPTGAGKTLIGLEVVRRIGQRALILTHSKELARQWRAVIKERWGIDAGLIGAGQWAEGEAVTVAMLQTLSRNPERTADVAAGYGLVLADEAHHLPAATFASVIDLLPARFRYGLSATPHRRDGLHFLINLALGDRLAVIHPEEVEAIGGTVPAEIQVLTTGFFLEGIGSWNDFTGLIATSEERHGVVLRAAEQLSRQTPVLVLVDRVDHAEGLAALAPGAVLAHGKLGTKARRSALERMRSAHLTVGTTGLLGEGVDVSHWGGLVLASPISSKVKLLQAVGRVVRPSPGKTRGVVLDFVDHHPLAGTSLRKRLGIYRERGFQVKRFDRENQRRLAA